MMSKKSNYMLFSILVTAMMLLIGCAGTIEDCVDCDPAAMQSRIAKQKKEIAALKSTVKAKEAKITASEAKIVKMKAGSVAVTSYSTDGALLPPNAKPGECYARVFVPPTYKTTTESLLKKAESERVEIIPAIYETVFEEVLVSEASEKLAAVPATYKWVEENVLVKAAHTDWKAGSGLIEKVDNATGEIMCLVEVPAEYKLVRKQVVDQPASIRSITIPAKYKTISVQKLVQPASENRIRIPAVYQDVTKTEKVTEGYLEWRSVLCEINMTKSTIAKIQVALQKAGYDPGVVDGVYGAQTEEALEAFQKEKGLASGGFTFESLKALGVNI